jgi:lipopolysaccharide transport system ATP-binding protein
MTSVVVTAEHLGKQYVRGTQPNRFGSLRESLQRAALSAVRVRRRRDRRQPQAGRFWAVQDVNFELHQGEVLGIIGRNGAGKSTLLKLVSEITEPTTGRITLHGRVASLLEVGTGFHPELTGRENIFLNGAILGMHRQEIARQFDAIVEFSEIAEFLDTQVKFYSSGMYMRLAFAVAAHLEPEILIVDEVLAVGDLAFQRKCMGKMEDVSHSGKTVLFVSHNMESIQRLCSTGLLLERGEVQSYGPVKTVVNQYLSSLQHRSVMERTRAEADPSHFHIESIEALDLEGRPKERVATWDPVRFRITYYAPRAFSGGAVNFQIATRTGVVLTASATQPDHHLLISMQPGRNVVDCVFPRLLLSAGVYTMGAGITVPRLEWLSNALDHWELVVEPADIWQSGVAPNDQGYLIPMDHRWELVQ